MTSKLLWTAVAATIVSGAACAADPLNIEKVKTVSATVTAVDAKTRIVSLQGKSGETVTFVVAPDVRNLAQVKVGDQLVVKYHESLSATVKPKGAPAAASSTVTQDAAAVRAEPGAKPGAGVGVQTTATVTVLDVDKKNHGVTFSGPDGLVRHRTIADPQGQKFIATLKKGDVVEMVYAEALAVSVEPAAAAK